MAKEDSLVISPLASTTLLFVATFTIMVGSVITPALPAIAAHLGFPQSGSWLVTLPSLGAVLSGRSVGRFIDRLGARTVMLAGLSAYGLLGTLAPVFAFSLTVVLADRLLLGVATAMVMAAGSTLISQMYQGPERLVMIGRQAQAIEFGGVLFLSVAGVLGSHGWQLPFLLYLLAFGGIPLVLISIPEVHRRPETVGNERVPRELRSVLAAATLCMMFFFVSFLALPYLLGERLHFAESGTGYFLAGISLVAVLVAGMLPRLARILSDRWLLPIAFALFGAGLLLYSQGDTLCILALGGVASGSAFGISIPLVNHLTVERSSASVRGLSLGLLSSAIFLGQFLSSASTVSPWNQQTTLLIAGALSLVAAVVWLCLGLNHPTRLWRHAVSNGEA